MPETRLTCSSCDARLTFSGKPGPGAKCPHCRKPIRAARPEPEDDEEEFEVVEEDEEFEVVEDDEPAPRRQAIKSTKPSPARKRPRDEDEDEEDEQPVRKRGADQRIKANNAPVKRRPRDEEDPDEDDEEERRPSKSRITKTAPARRPTRPLDDHDDEDDEEDRPRRRNKGNSRKKQGSPVLLWVGLGGGGLLVLLIGIVLIIMLMWSRTDGPPPANPLSVIKPPVPQGYQSPQAVYDAAKKAFKEKDAKTLISCITPDGRKRMATTLAMVFISFRSLPSNINGPDAAKADEFRKKVVAILDRHGLTEQTTKDFVLKPQIGQKPEDLAAQKKNIEEKIQALVKDPDGLLIDILGHAFENTPAEATPKANRVLVDVNITGETATGNHMNPEMPQAGKIPINFRKVDGGWLIDQQEGLGF